MAKIIFYPLGNADSALLFTDKDTIMAFDYAVSHNDADECNKCIDLKKAFREDIGWPKRKHVDVFAVTHGDDDHIRGIRDNFWLEHAVKYQGEDRVKMSELWVPAALLTEEAEDHTKIIRAEARHRFWNRRGIRVFSRPAKLKAWVESYGRRWEDYEHLVTDAGQWVPGYALENLPTSGIAFFVHAPFFDRDAKADFDRNEKGLVLQATIRSGNEAYPTDTRFFITGDIPASELSEVVKITEAHDVRFPGRKERLRWDIYKIPHHCSYGSLGTEKGDEKTEPTPEITKLLDEYGSENGVMVSPSKVIPSNDSDNQPPHRQAYNRYKETARKWDADLIVTMEHPSQTNPGRLVIVVDCNGPRVEKESARAAAAVTTTQSPRMG